MLEIINHIQTLNPQVKFLIENVKMKKEFEEYITVHTISALGELEKHLINSALVSAQNRKRYYWTNIPGVTQPEDRGIMLQDIIENGFTNRNKSHCLDANYHKGGSPEMYFNKSLRQLIFTGAAMRGRYNDDGTTSQRVETNNIPKANALTSVQKDSLLSDGFNWRKLTPLECERLQTLPDSYTAKGVMNGKEVSISNTQRYKMCGNGWTLEVIKHIFKGLIK